MAASRVFAIPNVAIPFIYVLRLWNYQIGFQKGVLNSLRLPH